MDWRGANSYPDSLNTKNPASKGPDCAEHTPIQPLLTRVLRCNITGWGVSLCMGVESPKQIFGVVGNLRSPALAGRAGRAQGLELNIQICPKPPTHYPKKVWLKVRLLSRGSSMRCNYYKCKILPPQLNTKCFRFLLR